MDDRGTIKLADFGASQKIRKKDEKEGGIRKIAGSPYFMAPGVSSTFVYDSHEFLIHHFLHGDLICLSLLPHSLQRFCCREVMGKRLIFGVSDVQFSKWQLADHHGKI